MGISSIGLNSLIVILIFGSLLLLSFIFIVNPLHINRKGNTLFGCTVLLWATFWIEEIISLVGGQELSGLPLFLLRTAQFPAPIIFYLSVLYFTNPDFRPGKKFFLLLILPFLYVALLTCKFFGSYADSVIMNVILTGLIIVQILIYTIASFIRINRHQKKIQLYSSNTHEIDLSWLQYVIGLVIGVSFITVLYNVFFWETSLNLFMNILFLLVIYWMAYFALQQGEVFPADARQRKEIISLEEESPVNEPKRKLIQDEEFGPLKNKLENLMEQQQPYLDCDLNLIRLAEMMKITPHQLSYLINTGFGENFFQFINRYRVNKAKELLLKQNMSQYSILGIAFESGFSSKTAFNTTFKKFTQETPSEFKRKSATL